MCFFCAREPCEELNGFLPPIIGAGAQTYPKRVYQPRVGLSKNCTQRIVVMNTHSCVPYVCFLGWPSFPLLKDRKKEFCNEFCGQTRFQSQIGSRHCAAALLLQEPISCTDIDLTPVAGWIFRHFALSWKSWYELGYEIISRFCM